MDNRLWHSTISAKTAIDTRSNRSTVSIIVVCHTVAGLQECLAGIPIAIDLSIEFTATFTTVTAIHWIMPCWANGGTGLNVRREVHIHLDIPCCGEVCEWKIFDGAMASCR